MSGLDERKGATSSKVQNEEQNKAQHEALNKVQHGAQNKAPEKAPTNEFKLPKWKKIIGEEYVTSNWGIQYDLLAIEEYMNNMIALGWKPVGMGGGTAIGFVPCQPGEYICRTILTIDKLGFFDYQKAEELSELLVADGATIVPQTERKIGGRIGIIALRASNLGPFEITSDLDYRIADYKARKRYGEVLGAFWVCIAILWMVLEIKMGNIALGFLMGATYLALAYLFSRHVPRYNKILKHLRHERDVSET